ncbi:retroviral-like aspartic protease family protein [Flavobacterium sp.]|uniref:retroviral-like aspartic protease family protein n=1 Tax=Flavobacterium sp. TaxID=239 RepID=UPI00261FFE90|nr:retroviral-like aspartic protease family protein [Flavobacterium sp.]
MRQFLLILTTTFLHISTQAQTVIKMEREGGVSIIPCKVNGIPMSFVFDTGASDVTISLTEANFMFKNGYLTKNDITGVSNYSDANGDITEGININLREIEIQGLKLYNIEASIVKNMDAPLLLGQSAISKLGTVQINLTDNTLTIMNNKPSFDFSKNEKLKNNNFSSKTAIIGKSKFIWGLEIAEYDFTEEMRYDDAKKACKSLGKGWRLPTQDELNILYKNKEKIGNFEGFDYWSSTLHLSNPQYMEAQIFSSDSGKDYEGMQVVRSHLSQFQFCSVRAVRDGKPISNSEIIGESKFVGDLEIAEFDFPKQMMWDEAKKKCELLGKGWRLPTKKELNILYQNKNNIGGFEQKGYWSYTKFDNGRRYVVNFDDGVQGIPKIDKTYLFKVRAVRTLKFPINADLSSKDLPDIYFENNIKVYYSKNF